MRCSVYASMPLMSHALLITDPYCGSDSGLKAGPLVEFGVIV